MLLFFRRPCVGTRVRAFPYEGLRSPTVTVTESFVLRPLLKTEGADYVIYLYMHCNFICGLSDVVIKTFSQSVNQSYNNRQSSRRPYRQTGTKICFQLTARNVSNFH